MRPFRMTSGTPPHLADHRRMRGKHIEYLDDHRLGQLLDFSPTLQCSRRVPHSRDRSGDCPTDWVRPAVFILAFSQSHRGLVLGGQRQLLTRTLQNSSDVTKQSSWASADQRRHRWISQDDS